MWFTFRLRRDDASKSLVPGALQFVPTSVAVVVNQFPPPTDPGAAAVRVRPVP
jgi:hypothetical protein